MSKKKSFEETIGELEATVQALESGNTTLEESLALFEKGVGLAKDCRTLLDNAEKRVSALMPNAEGELVKEPFADLDEQ